jgi:hypothetical protein
MAKTARYYDLLEQTIELRDLVMRALLGDRTDEDAAKFMDRQSFYPPDEEFELLEWQATNVIAALAREKIITGYSDEDFELLQEMSKEPIYSACVTDKSLVWKAVP